MNISKFVDYHNKVVSNCSKVIVGKDDIISLVLTSFVCGGHVLLEDIPGTGKTMLLRAFAKTIGGEYPVILLDDVFSELDENRRRYILDSLGAEAGRQIIITSCEPDIIPEGRFDSVMFHRVSDGEVE